MLLLVLIAVVVSIVADHLQIQHSVFLPIFNVNIPLSYAWYVFIFVVIAGTANATNLADGVDGLAAGTGIIALFTFTAINVVSFVRSGAIPAHRNLTDLDLAIVGAALVGAAIGFLWYNAHPAEIFMGDTGSMAFGGALAGLAIMTRRHTELLLLLIGGIFLIEALSVMIQVFSFKYLGPARVPDDADPPSLRDEGVVGDEDHGAVLDRHRNPVRRGLRALLPLLLRPAVSTTAAVLGAAAARESLGRLGGFDEIVVFEPSVERAGAADRPSSPTRASTTCSASCPVLPLPDASVDLLVGADPTDAEVARVLRAGRPRRAGRVGMRRSRAELTRICEESGTPASRLPPYACCRGPDAPHGGRRLL